jgi:hypothetical protein
MIPFILAFAIQPIFAYPQEMPDFGPDGLAGLTPEQREKLSRGKIILPESVVKTPGGKTLIEAALVFDKPPEEVWELLSKSEDQVKYLGNIKEAKVISGGPAENNIEFKVKILIKTFVYRQIHRFDKENLYFYWILDPDFRSDLKELNGYWRFYPFGSGKTLGRYGSRLLLRFFVPNSIQTALTREELPKALQSLREYVNSGGTKTRPDLIAALKSSKLLENKAKKVIQ